MTNDKHVSWTSPKALKDPKTRVSELEGYILSVYVRLHASGLKAMRERQTMPPTTLTPEIAEAVVGPYAYAMDAVFRGAIRSISDVDTMMTTPGNGHDNKGDEVVAWVYENDAKIQKARKRLAELTGDFRCVG